MGALIAIFGARSGEAIRKRLEARWENLLEFLLWACCILCVVLRLLWRRQVMARADIPIPARAPRGLYNALTVALTAVLPNEIVLRLMLHLVTKRLAAGLYPTHMCIAYCTYLLL